jgi:hypothetical protein
LLCAVLCFATSWLHLAVACLASVFAAELAFQHIPSTLYLHLHRLCHNTVRDVPLIIPCAAYIMLLLHAGAAPYPSSRPTAGPACRNVC